jgi:hypothetical protein
MEIPGALAGIAGIPRIEGLNSEQLAESLYDSRMTQDTIPREPKKWQFNEADLQSAACQKFRLYLWNDLFLTFEALALPQSEIDSATKRGKIQLIRDLLALTAPQVPEDTGAAGPNLGY